MSNYLFNFGSNGVFSPNGKVLPGMSQDEIDAHNREVEKLEIVALKERGRGILYVVPAQNGSNSFEISTWGGGLKVFSSRAKKSFHNMAGRDGRLDVWFNWEGARWHGVHIGDNEILRVKRLKK